MLASGVVNGAGNPAAQAAASCDGRTERHPWRWGLGVARFNLRPRQEASRRLGLCSRTWRFGSAAPESGHGASGRLILSLLVGRYEA